MKAFVLFFVIFSAASARPGTDLPNGPPNKESMFPSNHHHFYVSPIEPEQPSPNNQGTYSGLTSNQDYVQAQEPVQIQIPIPDTGADEKRIYVKLPPQEYLQQSPFQYRYPPRKHYKIILIRSPPTPPPQPVLPQTEEHTLVYVLIKKPDDFAELQQIQQQNQQAIKLHKPEVYFVTYKANEENSKDPSDSDPNANLAIKHSDDDVEGNLNLAAGYPHEHDTNHVANGLETFNDNGAEKH